MRVVLEGKKAGRCIFGKFLYVSLMKVVISKRRTHAINRNAVGQLFPFGLTLADKSKREQTHQQYIIIEGIAKPQKAN